MVLMWPKQSLVAISDARSDLITVAGFGRDSNPQSSNSETNPFSPRPRSQRMVESYPITLKYLLSSDPMRFFLPLKMK